MKVLVIENGNTQRERIAMTILNEIGCKSIKEFQISKNLESDGIMGINTYSKLYECYLKIQNIDFRNNFHAQICNKKQIVLHHSAGWDNARGMFEAWKNDGLKHVATSIGITDDGAITRGFDEQFWAVHIGAWDIGLPNYTELESQSVAVEICNWGALMERNGQFFTWVGNYGRTSAGVTLPKEKVIKLDYKGYPFYEIYTDEEIESLRRWVLLNALRFDIPLSYNPKDFWEVSQKAIAGVAGLYTHNSFISWKTDISPQPKMIKMLEKFNQI